MGSILCGDRESSTSDRILVAARSLLPISAFEKEVPGSSITLDNIYHSTSTQILKVMAYAISNNFPGHGNRKEIYRWLRSLGTFSPDIIRLLQDQSNQALLQGLLRLAVEEGDVLLASTLLDAGADPNANTCVHKECPIPLRPLQYSCLNGNLELVKELLRAKAQIDHAEFGWSCSPLLFAIYGWFAEFWSRRLAEEATIEAIGTGARDVSDSNDGDNDDNDDDNTTKFGTEQKGCQVEALLTLIHELLNAGADVNAIAADPDSTEYSLKEWRKTAEPHYRWYHLICEKHSALTLGSSFRCPELVDFLISNGAEISFHIDDARSALRECLYVSSERFVSVAYGNCTRETLADRLGWREDPREVSREVSRVLETAKRLIMAEVDVNDHKPCHPYDGYCEEHWDLECYSAFDLGILAQDRDLIDALWSAGAKPTRYSFDTAIEARDYDTFCQLLESEADFPEWAVTPDEWPTTDDELWYMESRRSTETQKRRAMILAAIRLGACAGLKSLARSYDCSNIVGNCSALREAIEKCCAGGCQDTLVCLLQSNILPQGSLASVLGSSIEVAIRRGHLETVDVLLIAGADVNADVNAEDTPLQLAIEGKRRELVQKLLDRGAKVETPKIGNLLVKAIHCGDHDIIQLLMAHASRDSLGLRSFSNRWCSPLAAAIFEEQWAIVDQLLQLGASVNPSSQHDRRLPYETPLWASVQREKISTAEWLIEQGAEVNDELALKAAADDEDSVLLRLLVEKLSTEERRGKRNALHVALQTAVDRGHLKNFRLILQSNIVDVRAFSNSLHHALKSSVAHRQEFLRSLLNAGASPDTITEDYRRGPYTTLLEAIHQRDPECVRIILETRARTNEELPPETAYSPLQLAAFEGNPETVRILLSHGQDPDTVSSCAETYQWYSGNLRTNHPIGTSVQNATMEKNCEILKALLQHGANPNATTRQCPHGPLQIACRDGSLELVEVLLEYGANVKLPPAKNFGATALQFAAIGGYVGIAHILLEKGADVDAEPAENEGRTALEGAAEHGRIDMVQLLKNAGADISESGQGQYERALRRASNNGHFATAKLLRSFLS
ncbi:ankyrin repeat-containing domain protein [Ilyonectria robusta]|uniref:ankyrin repeat-containing domain protein n=1 Tax=Ilyonectria robusta TaxID=1079257 RepID=UPI001E8D37F6|nr:ankyrin repeat-containing domain protein [Ilyonectria robusta]KAH8672229.1 ankyrin repeat-containing domain protein [Ilyonectria robusta]